jgi:hypothetical protein
VAGPSRLQRAGLLAVVIAPFVVAVLRALRHDWFPIGDNALLFIRTRDVFTNHQPFLGSWTSASLSVGENMNNPGPAYDFLIAPFAHVLSPGPAAAIGVATVNVASVIGVSSASRYIGGWSMQRWFLLASAALAWSMGSELLIDIWQANALLLPYLFFLVLIVGCASGRTVLIPWAAGVASLLIQTHISYAYILSLLIAASLVVAWFQHRPVQWRELPRRMWSRLTAITAAVVVALWLLPAVEQIFGQGRGNLTRLVENSSGGDVTLGVSNATKIASAVLVVPTWWFRSGFSSTVPITRVTDTASGPSIVIPGLPSLIVAVVGLIALIALLVWLTRLAVRRSMPLQACAGVLAAVSVAGVVIALSLLTVGRVGFSPHHVRWIWTQAVFVHVVIVWMAVDLWKSRSPAVSERSISAVAVALICLLSLLNLPYEAHPEGPIARYAAMPAMRRVAPELDQLEHVGPVLYDTSNVRVFEPYSSTMMMFLQQRGIEFRVADEGMVRQLGNGRRATGNETVKVFQLEAEEALLYDGPACPIAVTSALTPEQEATARADADVLAKGLVDGLIRVDTSEFTASEPMDLLTAARGGDAAAARHLVLDGTLSRWAASGWVDNAASSGTGVDNFEARLDHVDSWWKSAFGLFATGLQHCRAGT